MERSNAIAALAALAQDNRLDVYRLLVQAGPDGISAGAGCGERSGFAPNTLTFHFDRLAPGRSRHGAARRALDDLRRALRHHECAARLSHRELLQGRAAECARSRRGVQAGAQQARQGSGLTRSRVMKRMHVHVAVDDLDRSIGFYSALFATSPRW